MTPSPNVPRRGQVSYIDEIDDEEILGYIQKIRRIGGLPDLELDSRGGRVCETITYEHTKGGKKVATEDDKKKKGRKSKTYDIEVETDAVGMSKYVWASKHSKKPMATITKPATKETSKRTEPANKSKTTTARPAYKLKARIAEQARKKEEKARILEQANEEKAKTTVAANKRKARIADQASKEKMKIAEMANIAEPASEEKTTITETVVDEKTKVTETVVEEKAKITGSVSEAKITAQASDEKAKIIVSEEKIIQPPVMARSVRSFDSLKSKDVPGSGGEEATTTNLRKSSSSEKRGSSIFSRFLPKSLVRSMTAPASAFVPSGAAAKSAESSDEVEVAESPDKVDPVEPADKVEPMQPADKVEPVDSSSEVELAGASNEVEPSEEEEIVKFQDFKDAVQETPSTPDIDTFATVVMPKRVSSEKGKKSLSRFSPKRLVRSMTAPANAVISSEAVVPVKPTDDIDPAEEKDINPAEEQEIDPSEEHENDPAEELEIDPSEEQEIVPFRKFENTPNEKPSTSESPPGRRGDVKLVDSVPKSVGVDKRYVCGDVAIEDIDPGGYCAPSWYEIMDTCALIGNVWHNQEELLDPLIPLDAEDGAYDTDSLENESLESLLDGEDLLLEAQA